MNLLFATALRPNDTFTAKNLRAIQWARGIFLTATPRLAPGPAVRTLGILGFAILLGHTVRAQTILGSTGDYAVMAGSTVTTTGATTINGNLGGSSLSGSVTYSPTGAPVSPISAQNLTDLTRAFDGLAGMTMTQNLTGQTLGTSVNNLAPGVYKFTTAAAMTGNLVLDAQSQTNAVWVFQMSGTFNTTASTAVTIINTVGNPVANYGVFWQIGTDATFGANTTFKGNLVGSSTSAFSFGSGATINNGRVLTGATGTITLAGNTIDFGAANSGYSGGLAFVDAGNAISAVPEPSTYALFAGLAALGTVAARRRSRRAVSPAAA